MLVSRRANVEDPLWVHWLRFLSLHQSNMRPTPTSPPLPLLNGSCGLLPGR